MLIEFSVANFRSIKERATLSLVASNATEHLDSHVMPTSGADLHLLRSAAIYGANAAGKSNLLRAFDVMRDLIITSSKKQRGDTLEITPHLFDSATVQKPTEFEVIFLIDGVRYQYGFSATSERVFEEWLFAYPKGRPQRWIAREFDSTTSTYKSSVSEKVSGTKQVWIDATRENALLLSTAVQLNSVQFTPIFDWFKNKTRVLGFQDGFPGFTASLCEAPNSKNVILKMLRAADIDIKDIDVTTKKFDVSKMPDDFPESVKQRLNGQEYFEIRTVHSVIGGSVVNLDLEDESDGTQKLFGLLGPWMDILSKGMTVFVDELHDNLHPLMVRFLVSLFHNPKINVNGAQLIFTTHDTTVLNQKFLRRDQVWFVEKKKDNSSRLYPLTKFSPRKDREDVERNYLFGRYGAVPYLRDVATAMGVIDGQ